MAALTLLAMGTRADDSLPAGWHVVLRENFDSGRIDDSRWSIVPDKSADLTFDAHGAGKALHIRSKRGDSGILTRLKLSPPYRLGFDFLQPAKEAGGYRLVVYQDQIEGQPWWFEYGSHEFAVWTMSGGGWSPRWQGANMQPDTWYHVLVEEEEQRVRFTITTEKGAPVAKSAWIPHDLGTGGGILFDAATGGGLRGCVFDNIVIAQPKNMAARRITAEADPWLHASMAKGHKSLATGTVSLKTGDGIDLTLNGAAVASSVKIGRQEKAPHDALDYGGFWAWDISKAPAYERFTEAEPPRNGVMTMRCAGLHLGLQVTTQASADHITFTGELRDLTRTDRAVILIFALPMNAAGWKWGDDLNHSRPIGEDGRYQSALPYMAAGPKGVNLMSIYPWCSLVGDGRGIMVARPLDWPRVMSFFYDLTPGQRFVGVRVSLGLSSATRNFPSRASFRFAISRVPQAQWGFRAAAQRYYNLYPDLFVKRVKREGIWHLWVTTKLPHPEDFAMVFDEEEPYLADRIAFDKAHGGYSLTYSEPSTLWQHTSAYGPDKKLDLAKLLTELATRAKQPLSVLTNYPFWTQPKKVPDAIEAQAALRSYIGREGEPTSMTQAPPDRVALNCCDGNIGTPSRRSLWFDYEGVPALTDPRVDGAYVDSVGWQAFDAAEDFRREHWATAELPLVASFKADGPAMLAGFSHYELYKAIADAMHKRGKLTIANTFPYSHTFYAHLFDILGAGEAANLEAFHDVRRLSFCRALAYQKPVSHMNYAYFDPKVPLAEKERAMQRTLVYAVWPGSGNGATVAQMDKVRPLYRKYMPIFRAITAAGWEPITYARARPEGVIVERYGTPGDGPVYLAVHNPSDDAVRATVEVDQILAAKMGKTVADLVTGRKFGARGRKIELKLAPWQTAVLEISR